MEPWIAVLLILAAVFVTDWLFRTRFRQEGHRTLGARQRGPQTDWRGPTGEVIDELTGEPTDEDLPRS